MNKSILIAFAALGAVAANAQLLSVAGFETTTYVAGTNGQTINGQNGWAEFANSATGTNQVVRNGQTNAGGVTAASGNQMLRISTGTDAASARYVWPDITAAWSARTPGKNNLHAQVKVFIPTANNRSALAGISVFGSGGTTSLGAVYVQPKNATGGAPAVFLAGDTTGGGFLLPAAVKGIWNQLDIFVNQDTGTASGFFTSTAVGGTIYLGAYSVNAANIASVSDADLFNDNGGVAQTGTTVAASSVYFDDYGVEAVPEPGSIVAMAAGAALLVSRRRKA